MNPTGSSDHIKKIIKKVIKLQQKKENNPFVKRKDKRHGQYKHI